MSVVLSEHLPLIATAPDGIQKLRGLILELAVRGKLVPQDPKDEPASELLKRIAQVRAQLEAEGVCKKSKTPPLSGDEVWPSALAPGWSWTNLATVALINPRNSADDLTEASFVPMAMIGNRFEGSHEQETRKWSEIKQGFTHFAEGDVGVAKITPCFENSKACVFTDLRNGIGAGTTELHIVRPLGNTLSPRYVLAYLKAPMFLAVGETKMTGTAGQKRLPKDFLESNPFPLPPLAEQHRIVAKVDELMALCDRLEAEQTASASAHTRLVETLLSTLTQSVNAADLTANWQRLAEHFDTLFTTEVSLDALKQTILQLAVMGKLVSQNASDEPANVLLQKIPKPKKAFAPIDDGELLFEIPSNWQWARLGEVFVGGSGTTPPRTRHDYFDAGTEYWVKTTDLNNALVTTCEELITPQAVTDCNLSYYPVETVCIAMYGGAGTIGKTGVLGITSTINQSVFALPPVKYISPAFTHYYLKSIRGIWMRFAAGLRVAANINGQIIKNMVFPVPPLNEQNRIVAKVDALMTLCDRMKADLATASQRQATLADTLIETALEAA
ncbi:MAG: restriction endonuclease subunit S [Bacteroidota bacterium]